MNARTPNIFVEDSTVVHQDAFPGDQYVLRIHAPKIAAAAYAGSFVHLQCDTRVAMRRPLSIMSVNRQEQTLDILYKVVGKGLEFLSKHQAGATLNALGPIGKGFWLDAEKPVALLVGGGVGIPPLYFMAETLAAKGKKDAFLAMGSELPFPFAVSQDENEIPGLPANATFASDALGAKGISNRLASLQPFAGCYQGYVTDLAAAWLETLSANTRQKVTMYACGPHVMLKSARAVAERFDVPCQVALEEYMACAVGGCAGCAVEIVDEQGTHMKRVCVDGPVFEARTVTSLAS